MKITKLDYLWHFNTTLRRLQHMHILNPLWVWTSNYLTDTNRHSLILATTLYSKWLFSFVSVQTTRSYGEKENVKCRQNICPYRGGSINQLWWMAVSGFSRLLARAFHLLDGRGSPCRHTLTLRFLNRIASWFYLQLILFIKFKH